MENFSTFEECSSEFNKLFDSFEEKVMFLKNCRDDKNFIDKNPKFHIIKNTINFFVKNASVEETRKNQQKVLMPIIMKISKSSNPMEIIEFFQNDDHMFALFCITYVTFLIEESVNKHIDTYHKEIVVGLNKTVDQLVNFVEENR